MSETTPFGVEVTGNPTDVKGSVGLRSPAEIKALKEEMYKDFLLAKSSGEINLDYPFGKWMNRSLDVLENRRRHDIRTEWEMGKIGKAEYDALEEMRVKMIVVIRSMDVTDLDQYGIQHLDPTMAAVKAASAQGTPTHRPGVVKFPGQNGAPK